MTVCDLVDEDDPPADIDPEALCRQTLLAALEPPPLLTLSEWSDRYRILSPPTAAETGPYHTDRVPYLREIMDALSEHSPWERVVVMKASQLGFTESGNNWVGYVIHHSPGPMLYVEPTLQLARDVSKERLAPMIAASPELSGLVAEAKTRRGDNTTMGKAFPGGILTLTGANSAVGLRSRPVRFLFADEVDAYPPDAGGEGDPLDLALRRLATFEGSSKTYIVSTPTVRGLSRIERAFSESDQRVYLVPCPHCGEAQEITWESIHWPEGHPEQAAMVCRRCGAEIDESHKGAMLAAGRWAPTTDDQGKTLGDGRTAGYRISALYSPPGWYSWGSAARDFLAAREKGASAMQVWVNTVLGQLWDEGGVTIEPETLEGRAEQYEAEVPRKVLVLTAGVDIQADRIELDVIGWGQGEESWAIEHQVLHGDPHLLDVWESLDQALQRTYAHADGYTLPIACTCIDSGHLARIVYGYVKTKAGRRIFAVKGSGEPGRAFVAAPSKRRTGRDRRPVPLYIIGTDEAYTATQRRLRAPEPGPGFHHTRAGHNYSHEYYRQLCAMTAVIGYTRGRPRRIWKQLPGRAAEAWDTLVYATAALYILSPSWEPLAQSRRRQVAAVRQAGGQAPRTIEEPTPEAPKAQKRPPAPPKKQPPPRRPGGSSWVSSWRR